MVLACLGSSDGRVSVTGKAVDCDSSRQRDHVQAFAPPGYALWVGNREVLKRVLRAIEETGEHDGEDGGRGKKLLAQTICPRSLE